MKDKRPLSPHLQIYRLPMPAILSITHRFTGVILFSGSMLFSLWIVCLYLGERAFNFIQSIFGNPIGQLILIGYTFSLFYHAFNGIRHLTWDFGVGMDMSNIYKSGFVVISLSSLLTIVFWYIIYF